MSLRRVILLSKLKAIRELIFPLLEKPSPEQIQDQRNKLGDDVLRINSTDWNKNADLIHTDTVRLYQEECQRKSSADVKAGIYLAAVTAFAPVLVSMIPKLLVFNHYIYLVYLSLVISLLATFYLLMSGYWAFKTLKVSVSYRLDIGELIEINNNARPKCAYIKDMMTVITHNKIAVNSKVTCIKMAHEYLLRTFTMFIILLLMQITWQETKAYITPNLNKNIKENVKKIDTKLSPKFTIDYLGYIGPFTTAKTELQSNRVVETINYQLKSMLDEKLRLNINIKTILLIGITDRRALKNEAKKEWGSNKYLAEARAKKVKIELLKLLKDKAYQSLKGIQILQVPYGPTNKNDFSNDRKVDIYYGY
jgi:hypothetical protein